MSKCNMCANQCKEKNDDIICCSDRKPLFDEDMFGFKLKLISELKI